MSDFKDFLKERNLIPDLMKWYGISLKDNEAKDFIYRIVDDLSEIDDHQVDLDSMAKSYEKIVPHSQRKTMGEFFTPIQIVDYILKSVGYTEKENIENKTIIDLSCGSGSFLTKVVRVLIAKLKEQAKVGSNLEKSSNQEINFIEKVKTNIFGIDINPIACVLCQINLYLTLYKIFKNFLIENKEFKLPIFNIFNKDTLQYNFTNKYDLVIGNPPYLFIRAIPQDYRYFIENLPLETNQGQYDYYQIFIELGIKILKENGILGYIVPDSLLALSNRKILRKYIYESTKIREIYYTGPQFDEPVVSNIILTLEKESDEKKRKINQIIIKLPLNKLKAERVITQNLIEDWDYEFLININEDDIRILDHLNKNFPKLEELIESSDFDINLTRGVELGKEGEVIFCDNCQKYYPLPSKALKCPSCRANLNRKYIEKIIVDEVPKDLEANFKPFIYSMNRYTVNELKYLDITKKGINYKDFNIYKNRIVIRQISQENMICATYHDNAITSQSYYNLKVKSASILEFNNEYLLGLLNSKLLSYYFIKLFGSYKKLFPRILIEKLKALPIKVPEKSNETRMARILAENIQNILKNMKENKASINRLQVDSDLLVFHLFDINKKDQDYIINFIK
jgi:tRNA1(Val) A37 N6-methylase TrmN6